METDAEGALPSTLSILPLKDRVLLPSSAMKLVGVGTPGGCQIDWFIRGQLAAIEEP